MGYRDDDSWLERRFEDVGDWFVPEGSRGAQFLEGADQAIADLGRGISNAVSSAPVGLAINPVGTAIDWWRNPPGEGGDDVVRGPAQGPSIWGPGIFNPSPEQRGAARARDAAYEAEQAALAAVGDPWTAPIYNQPTFDPTGTSAPYDSYLSMLEGMYTTPQTGRIEEMYELGQGEARRRMETADAWEATESDRLDVSDEALDAALIGMQETFGDRLTTIREGTVERQAETADLRDGLIEAAAGELGEAGAAFLVSATRTGDVLESQRSRNEQHMNDMDGLWSMWSLDRTMQAAGMKQQARRDLADDVLAMKELVHEFDYGIQMANLEALQQAELFSQGQNRQLAQTLAQIGLTRDLAVQSASSEADDDWGRANAWLSNPTTGWAFEGMTPEMVMGMSDDQMQTLYAQAVRESEQIEVAPGVFVDAETAWALQMQNAGQTPDPTISVGGAALDLPTTPAGVVAMSDLMVDAMSNPDVAAVLEGVGTVQGGLGTPEAPVIINTDEGDPWHSQWNWGLW